MPTLTRLLLILALLAACLYGLMLALVHWVTPVTKPTTISIPAHKMLPAPEQQPVPLPSKADNAQ